MRTIVAFLIGAVSGIIGGVMFAPKDGKNMRKDANKLLNEQISDIEVRLNEQSDKIKKDYNKTVDEYSKKGKTLIGDLKDKVKA